MTTPTTSNDLLQRALAVATQIPISKWAPFAFGGVLLIVIYTRGSAPPPQPQVAPNPVAPAADFDPASTESDQQLLPDRLNLAQQQLISARAEQLKGEAAREANDKKNRCFRKSPSMCAEMKLSDVRRRLAEAIDDDGSLKISPSAVLALNVEAQAILAAMSGLGVRDENTERLTQVYLRATGGESSTLSGVAAAINGAEDYLAKRRVDRLQASGKSEDIPQMKKKGLKNGKVALDR